MERSARFKLLPIPYEPTVSRYVCYSALRCVALRCVALRCVALRYFFFLITNIFLANLTLRHSTKPTTLTTSTSISISPPQIAVSHENLEKILIALHLVYEDCKLSELTVPYLRDLATLLTKVGMLNFDKSIFSCIPCKITVLTFVSPQLLTWECIFSLTIIYAILEIYYTKYLL